MQTIDIALDDANLFCPATGRQILSEEKCEASPATLFVYVEEENVFEFVRDDLKAVAKEVEETSWLDLEDGRPIDRLLGAIDSPAAVDFVVTLTDMACGPVRTTIHVGIDMAHGSAPVEE